MNPSSPAVDIEGYLYKKESVGGFKRWQRRWATLCDYCLYLYDHHGDRESRYAFLLPSVTVSCCEGDGEFHPQLIKLEEREGKTVLLAASNEVEFGEWFNALSAAACLKRVKRQDFRYPPSNDANNNSAPEALRSASSRPVERPDGYLVRDEELIPPQPALMQRSAPVPFRSSQDGLNAPRHYREMSPDVKLAAREQRPLYAVPNRRHHGPEVEDPSGGFIRSAQAVSRQPIETVKEDPMMADSAILATRPLEEIKMKYPVSGLAKRMSIAASDLLGKSHDELLISLIQLNREKANLENVKNYLLVVLDHLHEQQASSDTMQSGSEIQEKIRRTIHELADVEHQIELSLPLITFIDNIVKMGAMYAGNDIMFATEYRKHLLSPQQYCPAKGNIAFARKVQEQQVARALSGRAPGTTSGSGIYDLLHEGNSGPMGESARYRQTREALERELGELQTIYSTFLGKRNELSAYMKDLPVNGGLVPEAERTSSSVHRRQRRKSGGDAADIVRDNTIKYPRRSTSKQPRSDTINSLRRRQSLSSAEAAVRLSYSLSSARLAREGAPTGGVGGRSRALDRGDPLDYSRSRSLPLQKERAGTAAVLGVEVMTPTTTTIVTTARYIDNTAAAAATYENEAEEETEDFLPPAVQHRRFEAAAIRAQEHLDLKPQSLSRARAAPQFSGPERPSRPPPELLRFDAEQWRESFTDAEPHDGDRRNDVVAITAAVAPRQHATAPSSARHTLGSFERSEDEDTRPRSSLQGQLDALIGRPRLSSGSDHGSRRHLNGPDRPLVRLTPSHYAHGPSAVTRLSCAGPDARHRSLERLGRYRDAREEEREREREAAEAAEASSDRPRRLPGLFVDADIEDPPYERLSAALSQQERQEQRVNGAVPRRIAPRRRRSDDFQMENPEMGSNEKVFDDDTIDRALFTPGKVNIRERYDPNSESDSDLLDDEERRQRAKRAQAIRRMLASHSLQEWTEAEVGGPRSGADQHIPVDRRQIEEEKNRREAILEMRQSLAVEVKQRSKAAARERERRQTGEFDHHHQLMTET